MRAVSINSTEWADGDPSAPLLDFDSATGETTLVTPLAAEQALAAFDPTELNVSGARLPAAYQAACTALERAVSVDECQHWANKAQALASYARQADDDTLQKQAVRIQSRAIRRCGELLREFNTGPAGGRPVENGMGALTVSQRQAAKDAGLSKHQQVQAVRVAAVPVEDFERVVESDTPPTVTKLADWGRKPNETPDWVHMQKPPAFTPGIQVTGAIRDMLRDCGKYEPEFIATGVLDYQRKETRRNVAKARKWLTAFSRALREEASHGL